jgi:hypothetical protein
MRLARLCLLLVTAFCGLTLLSGGGRAGDEPAMLPKEIFRVWMHSREEDADGVQVYRPEGYKFPPSRGRTGFEIKKEGVFIGIEIAPADGSVKVPGQWKLEGKDKIVVTFADPKVKPRTLQIVSCDDKMLKVK